MNQKSRAMKFNKKSKLLFIIIVIMGYFLATYTVHNHHLVKAAELNLKNVADSGYIVRIPQIMQINEQI